MELGEIVEHKTHTGLEKISKPLTDLLYRQDSVHIFTTAHIEIRTSRSYTLNALGRLLEEIYRWN